MKVKLQSSSKLRLVKAVKDILDIDLKEAYDLVTEQNPPKENGELYVKYFMIIDSEKTEEEIKVITNGCEVNYTFVVDCEPKVQPEQKLQEVTDDDLGVSIHSIDEMSIGWQRKMLFTREQAARVIAGLLDARINVTETHVMHEGNKVTMLTIVKTFSSGTRKKDLERFEHLTSDFVQAVCATISLEDMLERLKEDAIKAFNELRDYE